MGNDPKTSVINRYGQVHEIDNLFVADGSLHVTNGGFNPVLDDHGARLLGWRSTSCESGKGRDSDPEDRPVLALRRRP